MNFRVTWSAVVDATSPTDAANKAVALIREEGVGEVDVECIDTARVRVNLDPTRE